MACTVSLSVWFTTSLRSIASYPIGIRPPSHMPLALEAATLSRTLSEITSLSNCANESRTFRVSRPMLVVVLKACVIETKEAPAASRASTILAKSESERVNRSTL